MRNFTYLQPENLKQAAKALEKNEAMVMGGGTDLLDLLKMDIAAPEQVLNLKSAGDAELRTIEEKDDKLRIGGLVTLAELAADDRLRRSYTVLQEAAAAAATPQLRNAGTLGGNLCQRPRCWYFRDPEFSCLRKGGDTCFAIDGRNKFHCVVGGGPCYIVHPSDTAVALLALGAEVRVRKGGKTRSVPIGEFFVLPEVDPQRETILGDGEFVVGVEVPAPGRDTRSSYTKFKFREGWDFAVVSVALVMDKAGGIVRGGTVALGGVAPVPWLDAGGSAALAGIGGQDRRLDAFAGALLAGAEPMTENEFKVPLTRNLAKRALVELLDR